MKKIITPMTFLLLVSCTINNFEREIDQLVSEDYYFGLPGSKLFYQTTTKETQEKYHYSECRKKIHSQEQLRIESCVSSYWLKAKSL